MSMESCNCVSAVRTDNPPTTAVDPEEYSIHTSPVMRLQKLMEDCSFEISRIQLHSELHQKELTREIEIKTERIKALEKKVHKLRAVNQLQAEYIKKSKNVLYTEGDMVERVQAIKEQYDVQMEATKQKMDERFVEEMVKRDAVERKKYTAKMRQYKLKIKALEEKIEQKSLGDHALPSKDSTCSLMSPLQDDLQLQRRTSSSLTHPYFPLGLSKSQMDSGDNFQLQRRTSSSLTHHPYFPLGMSSKLRRSLTDLGRSSSLLNEADLRAVRTARCLTHLVALPAHIALHTAKPAHITLRTAKPAHIALRTAKPEQENDEDVGEPTRDVTSQTPEQDHAPSRQVRFQASA